MKLATPLVVALLTFALFAVTVSARAAPNGPAQQPAGQPPAPPRTSEAENLFWQSIMNSTHPADFEAYLEVFPNGLFRGLAQNRLGTLRTTATPNAAAATGSVSRFSIDFGDDTAAWARDGECDDIRFEGDGVASVLLLKYRGHDAADCRQLHDEGHVRPFGVDLRSGAIDFGDDASNRAQDGQCADPRFDGAGMDSFLFDNDRGHDAADCRRLYDEGRIRLFGVNPIPGR